MENQNRLEFLFNKFLKNQCTFEEINYLLAHFDLINNEDQLKAVILNHLSKTDDSGSELLNETRVNAAVKEVHESIIAEIGKEKEAISSVRQFGWTRMAAAALILIAFSAGLYFYDTAPPPNSTKFVKQQPVKNDIAPGASKAILTLANGSKIVLDDANQGILAQQNGISIRKTAGGEIIYDVTSSVNNQNSAISAFNTIETPKGGQYQINLPDGSKVWLNAASSLKFPVSFAGSTRKVELKGEAYFEVAKHSGSSFHVSVNHLDIEVLGTHFNVMAYGDEQNISTTLLEGAVKINSNSGNALLKPGQQAVFYPGTGNMQLKEADTEEAIAWKNGYFIFNSENFLSIMRKVSRWYNVEIDYRTDMSDKDFSGTISRFQNVSEVLKMLELTGTVHFKIVPADASGNERRIIVMP